MFKFLSHKIYHHQQNPEIKKLAEAGNAFLHPDSCILFGDYSQNPKKLTGRSGTQTQYRDAPDISLLNFVKYSTDSSLQSSEREI